MSLLLPSSLLQPWPISSSPAPLAAPPPSPLSFPSSTLATDYADQLSVCSAVCRRFPRDCSTACLSADQPEEPKAERSRLLATLWLPLSRAMLSCGQCRWSGWLRTAVSAVTAVWPLLLCALLVEAATAASASSSSPPSACWVTFAAVDANLSLLQYRSVAFSCPAGCLQLSAPASSTRFSSGVVEGSFPYSPSSSVCLSAVHCGLLNSTLGGSVFVSRFYRQDWSQGETQTIFPFDSGLGSTSNGVTSVAVPAAAFTVPSNGSIFSFTVRGRGEVAVQRRSAPFPPRSGHVHAAFPPAYGLPLAPPLPFFHSWSLIIGGYNGSHYLNHVWLAEPEVWTAAGSDISWRPLDAAPFSPRSDMQWKLVLGAGGSGKQLEFDLHLVGGQTRHLCGLTELGHCSDELWTLRLSVLVYSVRGNYRVLNVSWTSTQPVARLPFPSRCGASLLWFEPGITLVVAVVAGQLSYNDTTCRSPPVSVNDVWMGLGTSSAGPLLLQWAQQAGAPFSPRRSQQREDVLAITAPLPDWLDRQFSPLYPLAGGLRVLELCGGVNSTQLAVVEVYADVWVCAASIDVVPVLRCGWQQTAAAAAAVPSTSLPTPVALGPSATVRSAWPAAGQRFGGFAAKAAESAWLSAVPPGTEATYSGPFNWTYLLRPVPHGALTLTDVESQRWDLPMAFTLTDELRDPASSYHTGTEFVSSHSPWISAPLYRGSSDTLLPSVSTVHPQRWSSAVDPTHSSVFLPLPLSSLRTTRPHFRFELPRLSAGYDEWSNGVSDQLGNTLFTVGMKVVSGGRTGNRSSSDWIAMTEVRCLPPDDPSFLPLLGRLRWWTTTQPSSMAAVQDASFAEKDRISVACQSQQHFEPRLDRVDDAVLVCGPNGIWLDTDLQTIRVCMPNPPLQCAAPLVDTGERYCQPGRPTVTRLMADGATAVDALTLVNLPVAPDNSLYIQGSNFSRPLLVTVGGFRCDWPQLTGPQRFVCYNLTCGQADTRTQVCDWFSDSLSCTVPSLLGLNLPVLVTSGPAAIQAEAELSGAKGRVARVSSTPPVILFLIAYHDIAAEPVCNFTETDQLHLWNCPVTRPYNLSVCVAWLSVHTLDVIVTLGASQTGLPCVEQDPRELPRPSGNMRCLRCLVAPFLGTQAVRVQPVDLPLQSRADASLSGGLCPEGYAANFTAALNGLHTPMCIECPAGTSTRGMQGSPDCLPCALGYFAPSPGTRDCLPCPPGRFSKQPGAVSCDRCAVNQYQPHAGQEYCAVCDADSFVVYVNESSRAEGRCTRCPDGAVCLPELISAIAGRFLIIDQEASTLQSLPCSTLACKRGGHESCNASEPQMLRHASLPVLNCCGRGRRPAYTKRWETDSELRNTEGVNVLCALCQPGHTQMNGVCIPCSAVQWGRVMLVALLSLLLVFAVHRWSHDWSGAATMTISAYFLQQSDLFLSFSLLRTFNLDPLGTAGRGLDGGDDGDTGDAADWCVVPMSSDGARLAGSLLSTPAAFLLLAVVGLLHWLVLQALLRSRLPTDAAQAGARSRWRWVLPLYSIVFLASTPSRVPRSISAPPRASLPMAELSQPLRSLADETEKDDEVNDAQQQQQQQAEDDEAEGRAASPFAAAWASPLIAAQSMVVQWGSKAASAAPPAWLLYQRSFVRLLQLSYTAMALLTIRFFHLRPVGLYGQRVVDYPGLDPASRVYQLLAPMMSLCLGLVLAAPLLLSVFLLWQHRKGVIAELKLMTPSAASAAAAVSRRSALVLQLCCMFRRSCWWMAAFVPIRRLVVVAVLVGVHEPQVWVWLSLTNNALLAIHLQVQPYEKERDNVLETVMLSALCLQTTLLCLWTPAAQPAVFVSLVLGPVAFLAAVKAAAAVHQLLDGCRQHRSTQDAAGQRGAD